MTRGEFDSIYKILSQDAKLPEVSDDDYRNIDFVYTWHPCNFSKTAIISLYYEFGMCIIYDLIPRAAMALEHQHQIDTAKSALDRAKEAYNTLVNKDLTTKEALDQWQE